MGDQCNVIQPFCKKFIYNEELGKWFEIEYICSFRVYGKPIPKGSHRAFVRGNRAIITDSQEGLALWQSQIRVEAEKAKKDFPNVDWQNSAICLGLTFYFEHPKIHFTSTGKQSKHFELIHTKKPDFDKLARAVNDALTGTLFADDSQSSIITGFKFYGQPGVNIQVYILTELR